jgi:hypothetical protein
LGDPVIAARPLLSYRAPGGNMNLWLWLPLLFLLGLATMAALFAFVLASEKV